MGTKQFFVFALAMVVAAVVIPSSVAGGDESEIVSLAFEEWQDLSKDEIAFLRRISLASDFAATAIGTLELVRIRGDIVTWLISSVEVRQYLPQTYLLIRGLDLVGSISGASPDHLSPLQLEFERCNFDSDTPLYITGHFASLIITDSKTTSGVTIEDAIIDGELDIHFSNCTGPVRISDTKVTGSLSLGGNISFPKGVDNDEPLVLLENLGIGEDLIAPSVQLSNSGREALASIRLHVQRDALFNQQFRIFGGIQFDDTTIGGMLLLDDATLRYPPTDARGSLSSSNLRIGGMVGMRHVTSYGDISFRGAVIGGSIVADNAVLTKNLHAALDLDQASIRGSVSLRRAQLFGGMRLNGAQVEGTLVVENAIFQGDSSVVSEASSLVVGTGEVLSAIGAHLGGDLHLGFSEVATADWRSAQRLDVSKPEAVFDRTDAQYTQYRGTVTLRGAIIDGCLSAWWVAPLRDWQLILSYASVGSLICAPLPGESEALIYWPKRGNLRLNGFDYDQLQLAVEVDSSVAHTTRRLIDWLHLQIPLGALSSDPQKSATSPQYKDTRPSPEITYLQAYEQMAEALDAGGHSRIARDIRIQKNLDHRDVCDMSWSEKLWYQGIGPLIGYGYEPLRACWGILIAIMLGVVVFRAAETRGFMIQNGKAASGSLRGFNALVYAIDIFLPVIDLRQAKKWQPNPADTRRMLWLPGGQVVRLPFKIVTLLRGFIWLSISAGWLLTFILVAGLSGLVKT